MPKPPSELLVIEKTQALLVWTLNHIAKFPRSHRYGIGLRLETWMSDILDLLLRAKYTKDRLPLLQQANVELELLRFQFRTVKDVHCLSLESFGSACRFVNEIGVLVGGWIKRGSTGWPALGPTGVPAAPEVVQRAVLASRTYCVAQRLRSSGPGGPGDVSKHAGQTPLVLTLPSGSGRVNRSARRGRDQMPYAIQTLGINQLSRDERIELVLEIWDSIAAESGSTSISDSQRSELRRRVAEDDVSPDDVVEWEQVKAQTLAGLRP